MTTKDGALRMALDALERVMAHGQAVQEAKDILAEALAQPDRPIDFGPQPGMHGGLNQDDWKDIVAAISKARDSRGIYLGCRPADVFQDWFLAMGLFKPKEKANET